MKQKILSKLFMAIIVIIILPAVDRGLWSQEIPLVVAVSRKAQPKQLKGTTLHLTAGDQNTLIGNFKSK